MSRFARSICLGLALSALSMGVAACGDARSREISYAELSRRVTDLDDAELIQNRQECEADLILATEDLTRLKEQFENLPVAEVHSKEGRQIRTATAEATRRIQDLRACLNLLRREQDRRGGNSGSS